MTYQVEFQAVVLAAGRGSRMPEITAGKPKCLLPVGSKPLVWYPLYKLQQSGFTEVILVIPENHKSEIQNVLEHTDLEIRIDYYSINSNEDIGTADSLRLIQDKLKSDILVVSCDFISDVSLKGVLDTFRMHDASLATLFLPSCNVGNIIVPGPKSKYKPERDLVGLDPTNNRLVFLASASDFEEELPLPTALLKKHSNIKIYSDLIDSHVYVLKHWIIKYLCRDPNLSTIKGELLPFIVKKQLSKPEKINDSDKSTRDTPNDDIFFYASEKNDDLLITTSIHNHSNETELANDIIRCFAFVANKDCFGIRVNTLPSYCLINSKICDLWDKISNGKELCRKHPNCDVKSNQVDDKCFLWENCVLNEKTSFKNSTIGYNTQVSSFSRVFNSIIMNNVTIKEKVALENCIVCDGAVIESVSQLKNCLVGSHHTIPENSEYTHEILTVSDRLMEF